MALDAVSRAETALARVGHDCVVHAGVAVAFHLAGLAVVAAIEAVPVIVLAPEVGYVFARTACDLGVKVLTLQAQLRAGVAGKVGHIVRASTGGTI